MKLLFASLFIVRLFFATQLGVTYDEAYYWSWSKNLALSYYDHPAMVAWMIHLSTLLFGDTPIGIRFFPLLLSLLGSYAIYNMATKAIDKKAGEWAAVAFQATLLIGVGGIIMTPDLPLMLFWVLCLLALFNFIEKGQGGWWLVIGLCVGLGFTSKYSALFLALGLVTIALRHLKNPWVYGGGVIALIAASPPILWNVQNEWISFLKQGSRIQVYEFNPVFMLEFIAGQGLLITPFIGILLLYGLFKPRSKYINSLLITSAPLFLFLLWQSLFSRVEGNWAAPLLPAAIIIASLAVYKQWLYKYAAPVGILFSTLFLSFLWLHPFKLSPNLTDQLYGGKEIADILKSISHDGIYTNHYTTNAWLRFYINNIDKVQQLSEPERYRHEKPVKFKNALLVVEARHLPANLNIELIKRVDKLYIYRLTHFNHH